MIMKQLAVRSLSWGLGMVAIAQLPVLASNQAPNAAIPSALLNQTGLDQTGLDQTGQITVDQVSNVQLVAVALSSRRLSLGDSGPDVRVLQRYLSRNGLYPFEIDGTYGQETANSVATYQRIRGLSSTGIADEATLKDMDFEFLPVATTAPTSRPIPVQNQAPALGAGGGLSTNAVGSDVIALQQRLNAYGIPVFIDGVYGFETQQAVRTYQRVQGLPVSGIADSATLQSMGFSVPDYPYVAAIIADESELASVQQFFADAYIDRNRRGRFINIGSFGSRFPAEARVNAAAARGFQARVLYR